MCPGGVLEAYPPSDCVTHLTVDLLLEPGGEVTMLSCYDQLHGSCQLKTIGSTFPQTSVQPGTLHSICMRVGQARLQRNIIGYVSVDLVTFMDHKTMEQKVRLSGAEQDKFMQLQHMPSRLLFHLVKGILDCTRDPYEQIGAFPRSPLGFGKQARQTVGAGIKCVTSPSNKLSGLIVSIH